ncbi:molecular chaperone [Aliikangiella sp. G2MR2-5]|uniref:fimbrial biogenesis chaperone n=1 Tax=Aliikangiella sp. G2MR2-5 TaxID=2788943 RepID=UPI0018A92DE1|nr:hypothetical protein [Aliikangiella sp. G2MR2-5]
MRILILILGLFSSLSALAGISISKAIVHFEAGGQVSEDVEVFNQGDETLYIRIEPSIIKNPGSEQAQRVSYRNPKDAGLLVTPQRMVIAPGARKRVRFVRLDDAAEAKEDRVFRVLIKPEVGKVSSRETAVKVIIAYEVLVLSQPGKIKPDLQHKIDNGKLYLYNAGNTNILIQNVYQCPPGQSFRDEQHQCKELSGKRLYADTRWESELPLKTNVTIHYSIGLDNRELVIDFPRQDQTNKKTAKN